MGRRSFISQTTINRIFSAASRRKKERERDALIKSLNGTKELPTEYSLISVDFSPSNRMTKICYKEEKKYRTVERYVTRNYVKYPVLSEWKTKIKHTTKTLRLSNDALEKLNYHSDVGIRELATEIILKIGNDEYYPSWFLKDAYRHEYFELSATYSEELKLKYSCFDDLSASIIKDNASLQFEIKNLAAIEAKQKKRFTNITNKRTKALNRKKSMLLNIITLGIYSYTLSSRYISKLESKLEFRKKELSDTHDIIAQTEDKLTLNNKRLKEAREKLEKEVQQLEASIEAAHIQMEERIAATEPLVRDIEETDVFVSLKKFVGIEYTEIKGCYIIRNKENQKCYVGQSKDVLRRIRQHFHGTEAVSRVFLSDYYTTQFSDPSELFEVKIVPCETKDELDRREKELITEYDSYNNGYNNTQGNK